MQSGQQSHGCARTHVRMRTRSAQRKLAMLTRWPHSAVGGLHVLRELHQPRLRVCGRSCCDGLVDGRDALAELVHAQEELLVRDALSLLLLGELRSYLIARGQGAGRESGLQGLHVRLQALDVRNTAAASLGSLPLHVLHVCGDLVRLGFYRQQFLPQELDVRGLALSHFLRDRRRELFQLRDLVPEPLGSAVKSSLRDDLRAARGLLRQGIEVLPQEVQAGGERRVLPARHGIRQGLQFLSQGLGLATSCAHSVDLQPEGLHVLTNAVGGLQGGGGGLRCLPHPLHQGARVVRSSLFRLGLHQGQLLPKCLHCLRHCGLRHSLALSHLAHLALELANFPQSAVDGLLAAGGELREAP
mmetsp:Transcript_65159/g.205873  ORF Transcript_65159/g.205873 Transcript_65159/m.205873 type:complete len:358 (-) Transcript_65159:776-1849(-)